MRHVAAGKRMTCGPSEPSSTLLRFDLQPGKDGAGLGWPRCSCNHGRFDQLLSQLFSGVLNDSGLVATAI